MEGRYKAILVEPGNCFWALLDYIHLNPVRAGIVGEKDGIESYAWSSLPHYVGPARKRPPWLETARGLEVCGCVDTAAGRREFLGLLERRVDWRNPRLAGTTFPEGDGWPQLAVYSSLRRDGSSVQRRSVRSFLDYSPGDPGELRRPMATMGRNSTTTRKRARALIRAALEHFGTDLATLRRAREGD